ncbi:PIF1 [Symbiodinium microadriaticum]|nr:PIF1 [Symbiodinium microadriaticum]
MQEGTLNVTVIADTQLHQNTHVVVYTRSSLVEQTTPAFLEAVGLDTMLVRNRWMSRVRRLLFFRACLHLKSYDIDQSPLQISDTISSVPYLRFTDLDLDPLQIGGYLEWVAPEDDNSTITHYTLYAAEDALGSNRTQITPELPFGTTAAVLPHLC